MRRAVVSNLKIISYCFLIYFVSSFSIEAQDDKANLKRLELVVFIPKVLKFDFIPNTIIKIGNEGLVEAQVAPSKREIILNPLKPGETSLIVRDANGDVKEQYLLAITSSDQARVVGQLKELLSDVEGLEIGLKGDSVFVGGQIVVPADIGKVVVILSRYPDVLRLVELSPQTQLIIAKKMQDEMQKSGLKDVTVRVVNGVFWIEGIVDSKDQSDKAEQIAKAYLPDQIQNLARQADAVQQIKRNAYENLLTINSKPKPEPPPKLFKITTQFVELTKAYSKVFSFNWIPLIGEDGGSIQIGRSNNGGVTTNSSNTLAATISNLFPKLNSAKSAGFARVVQSAVILTKEGVSGTITKSSSTPYLLGSGDGAKEMSASAGITIGVTPTSLQEEKINLKIKVDVNANDGASTPTTFNNSVGTELVLKSQESAAIGGVVTSSTTTDYDKQPTEAVENGSPLFTFIKGRAYKTNKSQFVIFVTPEIVESASQGSQEIERKFRKRGR